MNKTDKNVAVKKRFRWIGVAIAVVVPFVLAFIFWRMTPAVGGWMKSGAESGAKIALKAAVPGNKMDPKAIYAANYARCHEAKLEGKGKVPSLIGGKWPYAEARALLVKTIRDGKGLKMPRL